MKFKFLLSFTALLLTSGAFNLSKAEGLEVYSDNVNTFDEQDFDDGNADNSGSILYDVDFSIPPHTVNAQPLIGDPSGIGAVSFGNPIVRTAVGDYQDHCLEFEGGSNVGDYYEIIQFFGNVGADLYRIEFDFYPDQLVDGFFGIAFDTGNNNSPYIRLDSDGSIDCVFFGQQDIDAFEPGELISMRIDISVANSQITIWKNNSQIYSGAFEAATGDIGSISLGLVSEGINSNRVALDNFYWIANPQPVPEGSAELALSTASLNFENVRTDQSRELELTVTNTGGETLTLSEFVVSEKFSCPITELTLQPLRSAVIPVTFLPDALGAFSGNLTFTSNESENNSYSISLNGTGVGLPQANVETEGFTVAMLTETTYSETFELTNSGIGILNWSVFYRESNGSVELAPAWISIEPESGVLTANSTTEITLNLNTFGLAPNIYNLDVILQTNDPSNPEIILPLSLTVSQNPTQVLYDVDFSIPPHIDNSQPLIGGPSGIGAISLGNPIVRTAVGDYQDNCLEFEGGSNAGDYYEQIQFFDNGGADYYRIEFDFYPDRLVDGFFGVAFGTSNNNFPYIRFDSDGTIDCVFFGQQDIGAFEPEELVSMRIDISTVDSQIIIWNNNSQIYSGAFSVAGSNIGLITLGLASEGLNSNRVALDNFRWIANPQLIPESPAELALSATSLDFSDVRIDQSRTLELTAINTGGETLTLSGFAVSEGFNCPITELTLQPLESAVIPVTFSPDSPGVFSGNLIFTSNEPENNSYSLSLNGTGVVWPQASVGRESFTVFMLADTTYNETFELTNSGASILNWSVFYRESNGPVELSPSWISVEPESGVLTANSAVEVTLNLDTVGLVSGTYNLDIVLQTNDPSNPEIILPLSLTVSQNPTQVLYDVDFSIPPHAADTQPLIGGPSGIGAIVSGDPIVRTGVGDYQDDCLEFEGDRNEQIQFFGDINADYYRIEFDFYPDRLIDGYFMVFLDNFPFQRIKFDSDGTIDGQFVDLFGSDIGNFNSGELVSMRIDISVVNSQITIWKNNSQIYSGFFFPDPSIHFSLVSENFDSNRVALDNFRWIVNPQPIQEEPAELELSATFLDFGNVRIDQNRELELTATNTGGETLTLSEFATSAGFSCPITELTLQPLESAIIPVTFSPGSLGAVSGNLTFTSNEPENNSYSISLNGTGVGLPQAGVETESFIVTALAGTTYSETFELINSGFSELNWSIIYRESNGPVELSPSWISVEPESGVLIAGDTAKITLNLDTLGLVPDTYNLDIVLQTDDPSNPEFILPLSLTVEPNPRLQISNSSLNFGSHLIGTTNSLQITLNNIGSSDLLVSSITSSNSYFTTDFPGSETIAAGNSSTLTITFSPTSSGEITGQLTILSNDLSEPEVSVNLSGVGMPAPQLQLSSESFNFNAPFGANPDDQSLTITNTGGAELVVDLSIQSQTESQVIAFTPSYVGHSEYGLSKEDAEAVFAGTDKYAHQLVRRDFPRTSWGLEPVLSEVLSNLDDVSAITSLIPNMYAFGEGITGDLIGDGGNDMFDGGNRLHFGNLAQPVYYSNGIINTYPSVNPMVNYFTLKKTGLFVLAADLNGLNRFAISGNLGTDGSGIVEGVTLQTTLAGASFTGFFKRVHSTRDPSVNQLIIFRSNGAAQHTFATNTDNGSQSAESLNNVTRVYYLLFASSNGGVVSDETAMAIMNTFLEQIEAGSWLEASTFSLQVPAGESVDVDLTVNPAGMTSGSYGLKLQLETNDPLNPSVQIPVNLEVAEEPVAFDKESLQFVGIEGLPMNPQSLELTPLGAQPGDAWEIEEDISWLDSDQTSGVLPDSITLSVSTDGIDPGLYSDEIIVRCNGAIQKIQVSLNLAELNPYFLEANIHDGAVYSLAHPTESEAPSILLKINDQTGAIENFAELVPDVNDLAFAPDGEHLYAFSGEQATIAKVSTNSLEIVAQRNVSGLFLSNGYEDSFSIEIREEEELLLTDAYREPYLLSFDFADSSVGDATRISGAIGFGKFKLDHTGQYLFSYRSYYNSFGELMHSTILDNLVHTDTYGSAISDMERGDPIMSSPTGDWIAYNRYVYKNKDFNMRLPLFTQPVYAASYYGDIAISQNHIYDGFTGALLHSFTGSTRMRTVNSAQNKLISFDATPGTFTVFDLSPIRSLPSIGLNLIPSDGGAVSLNGKLRWTPGATGKDNRFYIVYLGNDRESVENATLGSPEFLGIFSETEATLPSGLSSDATYFWKIDTVDGSQITSGTAQEFYFADIDLTPNSPKLKTVTTASTEKSRIQLNTLKPETVWSLESDSERISFSETNGNGSTEILVTINVDGLSLGEHYFTYRAEVGGHSFDYSIHLELINGFFQRVFTDPLRNKIYALHYNNSDALLLEVDHEARTIIDSIRLGNIDLLYDADALWQNLYLSAFDQSVILRVDLDRFELAEVHGTNFFSRPSSIVAFNDQRVLISYSISNAPLEFIDLNEGSVQTLANGEFYDLMLSKDEQTLWAVQYASNSYQTKRYLITDNNELELEATSPQISNISSAYMPFMDDAEGRLYMGQTTYLDADSLQPLFLPLTRELYGFTSRSDLAIWYYGLGNLETGTRELNTLLYNHAAMPIDENLIVRANNSILQYIDVPEALNLNGRGVKPLIEDESVVFEAVDALEWNADTIGYSYHVYWGFDETAVANADMDSPLYRGLAEDEMFNLAEPFGFDTKVFWRIDAIRGEDVVQGDVWSFSTVDFTVSEGGINESAILLQTAFSRLVGLNCAADTQWSIVMPEAATSWLSVNPVNGVGPAELEFGLDPAGLPVGLRQADVELIVDGSTYNFPVDILVSDLNLSHLIEHPTDDYLIGFNGGTNDQIFQFVKIDKDSLRITESIDYYQYVTYLHFDDFDNRVLFLRQNSGSVMQWSLDTDVIDVAFTLPTTSVAKLFMLPNNRVLTKEGNYLRFRDLSTGTEFQSSVNLYSYGNFDLNADMDRLVYSRHTSSNSLFALDYINGIFQQDWSNRIVRYPRTPPLLADNTGDVYLYGRSFDENGILINGSLPTTFTALSPDGALAAGPLGIYAVSTGQLVQGLNSLSLSLFSRDGTYLYGFQDLNPVPNFIKYRIDAGELEVTPDILEFPDTFEFGASSLNVELLNIGFQNVTVSDVAVEGSAFSVSGEFPLTLATQETVDLPVEFNPENVGDFTGRLLIYSNDPDNAVIEVALTGRGIQGPTAEVSTEELSASLSSQQTTTLSFDLSNTGAAALDFSISDDASWIDVEPFGGSVASGSSTTIEVILSAGTLSNGIHEGSVEIVTNDPLRPLIRVSIILDVTAVPVIELEYDLLDFGRVIRTDGSAQRIVNVRNTGIETLNVNVLVTTGNAHYSVNSASLIVSPGSISSVLVTFDPSNSGELTGNLRFNSNDPVTPQVDITTSGYGAEHPEISVNPGSLSFALNSGDSTSLALEIANPASEFSELVYNLSVEQAVSEFSNAIMPFGYVPPGKNYPIAINSLQYIEAPGPVADSISEATVFIVGASSQAIYEINPNTGETIRTIELQDRVSGGPDGLAFDGQYLYFTNDSGRRTIYQIDSQTGAVIDTLPVENMNVDGLAHDGEHLYALDYVSGSIAVIRMGEGVVRTLNPNLPIGGGITSGGSRGTLFVSNFNGNLIEIDKVTGELIQEIPNSRTVYGVGYSEAASALITSDASAAVLRYIDPDTGQSLGSVNIPFAASGVAADESAFGVSRWLSVTPTLGTVRGSDFSIVEVTADASALNGGIYEKQIVVQSTAPEQPELIIPVTLVVTGAPGIEVTPSSIDFGTLYTGGSSRQQLQILNVGTDDLIIDSLSIPNNELEAQGLELPLLVAPGSRVYIDLVFNPSVAREVSGSFNINSNDESDASFEVNYSATVLDPPVIETDLARLDFNILPGESGSQQLTIRNTGGSRLEWSLGFSTENLEQDLTQGSGYNQSLQNPTLNLNAESVQGSIIVRFEKGVSNIEQAQFIAALGAKLNYTSTLVEGLVVLELPQTLNATAMVSTLSADNRIFYAEPDYTVKLVQSSGTTNVNDPRFDELWGLKNIGQSGGTIDADIDAEEAWTLSIGSREILVGVIDTGVDYTHPDLAANIWTNPNEISENGIDDDNNGYVDDVHGWDFAYNDNDPMDVHGHGTHVAGTIGAVGNDGIGVVGVSQLCTIVPIKFLDDFGSGQTSNAIQCIEYAITMGVDLTNNSWGGSPFSSALRDVIARAGDTGQLFVAAAGNSRTNTDFAPNYPSGYDVPEIISVAATDRNDLLASYSNYGATSVDLGAPGSEILSTTPGSSYAIYDGTSMASPHVAGAAALIKAYSPSSSALEIKQALLDSVDQIPSLNNRVLSNGRLNLLSALEEIAPPWVAFSETSGSIDADYESEITISIDTSGMDVGSYEGNIIIRSNDPDSPLIYLPVVLQLGDSNE